MSEAELKRRLAVIDIELSPENVSWDGERPQKDVDAAVRVLEKERADLLRQLETMK